MDLFQKLAVITTATTYLLILVGGLVRASGSGLGCPDWPKCFGLLIPPTKASDLPPGWDPALFNATHTWIEFLNRLLGATVGILILATLVVAIVKHRRRALILWPTVLAFAGVLFAGWLGKVVISSGLSPWMVTAHLVVAIVVVSALLFATAAAFLIGRRANVAGRVWMAIALILATLGQAGLGTQVRHAIELQRRAFPEAARSAWVDAVGGIDILHRQISVALFVLTLLLLWRLWKLRVGRAALVAAAATFACTSAQIALGLMLVYVELPVSAQILHLTVGSLLLGAQTILAVALAYDDARSHVT